MHFLFLYLTDCVRKVEDVVLCVLAELLEVFHGFRKARNESAVQCEALSVDELIGLSESLILDMYLCAWIVVSSSSYSSLKRR